MGITNPPAPPTPSELIGRQLGSHIVDSELGTGGMGKIFLGHHATLTERRVAIKVLHTHLLKDRTIIERFRSEANIISRLSHQNCIQIIDFGTTDDGILYLVMEFVDGYALEEYFGLYYPMPSLVTISILLQVCGALQEAHAAGIVHRDLKPENVMIRTGFDGSLYVKVLDFGIAKFQEEKLREEVALKLTATGTVCGTPQYMAPEQLRAQPVDHRADIYGLGVVLYKMLTGVVPFDDVSPMSIGLKVCAEEPLPILERNPHADPLLAALAHWMIKKNPDERPADVGVVIAALKNIAEQRQPDTAPTEQRMPIQVRRPRATPTPAPLDTMSETRVVDLSGGRPVQHVMSKRVITGVSLAIIVVAGSGIGIELSKMRRTEGEVPAPEPQKLANAEPAKPLPPPMKKAVIPAKPLPPPSPPTPSGVPMVMAQEWSYGRRGIELASQAYATPPPQIAEVPKPAPRDTRKEEIANARRAFAEAKANSSWSLVIAIGRKLLKATHDVRLLKDIGRAHVHLGQTNDACSAFKQYSASVRDDMSKSVASDLLQQFHCQ